jgi:transcriptional regulator with XRE-family HTH domain
MTGRRFKSPDLQRSYDRYIGREPRRIAAYEAELADAEVGMMVRELRRQEGLTQSQLAARIGTTATAISRIESADYAGHSLAMLRRVAGAVGKKVVVRFVPESGRRGRTTRGADRQRRTGSTSRVARAKAGHARRTA